jgi:hypothetical protein
MLFGTFFMQLVNYYREHEIVYIRNPKKLSLRARSLAPHDVQGEGRGNPT